MFLKLSKNADYLSEYTAIRAILHQPRQSYSSLPARSPAPSSPCLPAEGTVWTKSCVSLLSTHSTSALPPKKHPTLPTTHINDSHKLFPQRCPAQRSISPLLPIWLRKTHLSKRSTAMTASQLLFYTVNPKLDASPTRYGRPWQ